MRKHEIYTAIVECVGEIQRGRRAAGEHPDHAMIVRDRLAGLLAEHCTSLEFYIALGELVELGRIETGRTINDTYVRLVEE